MSTRHHVPLVQADSPTVSLSTFWKRVVRVVGALPAMWRNRRAMAELLSLDDYMLRDIGVTRQDVHSALAQPLFRDASWRLAERARDARRASRALAQDARWLAIVDAAVTETSDATPGADPRTGREAGASPSRPRAA